MKMISNRITVFTPTYNRAYILHKCYESLKRQTNSSFEWLIVDDGSTDNTEELVRKWIDEDFIKVRYFKQENGGKQRAHNYGVELCDTELFICVDSDDYLTYNAIEEFLSHWNRIQEKDNISGIMAMKGSDVNSPLGGKCFPENVEKSTLLDMGRTYKCKYDIALLYRTEILKQFPFYVYENEKFMGESYTYSQIDQKYQLSLLLKVLYICEYLPDGYSKNVRNVIKANPKGYMRLKSQSVLYSVTFREKYINTMKYIIGCKLSKQNCLEEAPSKVLAVLAYIPAMIVCQKLYRK